MLPPATGFGNLFDEIPLLELIWRMRFLHSCSQWRTKVMRPRLSIIFQNGGSCRISSKFKASQTTRGMGNKLFDSSRTSFCILSLFFTFGLQVSVARSKMKVALSGSQFKHSSSSIWVPSDSKTSLRLVSVRSHPNFSRPEITIDPIIIFKECKLQYYQGDALQTTS